MISVGFRALFRREVLRFVRRPKNTFMPPAITNVLYFAVFGVILGGRIDSPVEGVPGADFGYILFLIPGLVVLGTISNAFENASFSIFHGRWNEYIHETLTSPLSYAEMVVAYVGASAVRGLIVGLIVAIIGALFVPLSIANGLFLVTTMVVISALFAGFGIIGGLIARDFDDLTVMNQFILRPLVFFGAVFYSLTMLEPIWQYVSLLNPMVYMVDSVRYGLLGYSDMHYVAPAAYAEFAPYLSLVILSLLTAVVVAIDIYLFKTGYGLTD
ncbi:ABC transporter permease [Natronobacterium gregoryi]|uniref:ABC transporter n=2 Tax=Natronobacterium gregoryi TaxID=44930 RepID=L0AIH2_NATGS|nr:ABC transporter permease [Natronobacterium gregoryi]AFZ72870.1 ABC-type polysaccharide/polyol phosphate export systems, permease component [Natronobacterium gregoryi SP2]ELY69640.1 ABC transporter [Natronobacterium gregoryi SP2]PLK21901.1 ABC transporter [Natronobacterium gregoryi SP2]SFI66090.1 ABC-2 type transport system permease protein [Natronobacterium gregoryi]